MDSQEGEEEVARHEVENSHKGNKELQQNWKFAITGANKV